MVSMLWNLPPDPRDAETGLRFISAAPIAAERYHAIEERYRCRVVTMYGLTEAFPIAYKAVSEDGRPGTSGHVNPDFEVRIVDLLGEPVPEGMVGEIACRARSPHAMSEGYVASASGGHSLQVKPHSGWFRTGDLGHMDEEGFVYITGRASDMYISGGSNIYPREVEEKILTHPAIGEVAVLGVPDPFWGEVGVAVCVSREGAAAVSEAELAAFLAPKVPRYKMPKRFFFWEALPKSGYGKIPKRLVRDELEARGLLELVAKSTGT
jgi:acyl-CoA synthetase (AMP-forming)/AMP-acid ligase II